MASYLIEHLSNDATPVPTDISAYLYELDSFSLYSDGRISTASLTLRASGGAFKTNTNSGTTPILNNFDRIRITVTDLNGMSYKHIFEIINDMNQLTNKAEYLLPLTLEGRERALAQIPFSAYTDPAISSYEMLELVLNNYFVSYNPIAQPLISTNPTFTTDSNQFPTYNPNIWDFLYIDNSLDAIIAIGNLSDQSVDAGGSGDRFAIIFEDHPTIITRMTLRVIPQGENNPTSTVVIRGNQLTNPISSITKIKEPLTGTTVIARGRPGSGGVPVEGDQYRERLEEYKIKSKSFSWINTTNFPEDALASWGGVLYKALRDNINKRPDQNVSDWVIWTVGDYIGNIQYSPFTIDKATLYRNECTNPQLAFNPEIEDSPKMLDCNIVINDYETERDFVWIRQITDDVSAWSIDEKKYLFRGRDVYNGFRLLVDGALGTPSGAFSGTLDAYGTGAGNDPNKRPYLNNTVAYVAGKWFVIREVEKFDQVLVRFEGLFEWNGPFAAKSESAADDTTNPNRRYRIPAGDPIPTDFGWRELGDQFLSNDCLHSPASIRNVTGLIGNHIKTGTEKYSDDSAVEIVYQFKQEEGIDQWRLFLDELLGVVAKAGGFIATFIASVSANTFDLFTTPFYRNMGWWITMSAPLPFSTHNGITEQVGQLYGAGTDIFINTLNRHSAFDAYNKSYTFTGMQGWVANDSNTLMEITGVKFLFNLDMTNNGVRIPLTGDVPASWWAIDDNGTIWKKKVNYRHLGDTQTIEVDYGDFSPVYRARTPLGINSIITNILAPELEIRERLFPNRIRIQGFMLEGGYDDKGRYFPNVWDNIIKPSVQNLFTPTVNNTIKYIGIIDNFQWVKTPIAIASQPNSSKTIVSEFRDYPDISSIEQLQRAANADVDVETFPYEQFEIVRNDRADLALQDSVYLYEKNMIPEAEAPRPATAPAWSSTVKYYPDDLVTSFSIIYIAQDINTNVRPATSGVIWLALADPVLNTRKLTVGEIHAVVSKEKEISFTHTLIRRIPRII